MSEVLTEHDGAVLTITLNRPDVFNAFNAALHARLHEALEEAASPEVRAVVITGAGRGFCSGQDLKEFQEAPGSIRDRLEQTYHPNIRLIRALEKPVIAAVNGPCAGAGLSLAAACDIRIASDAATFVPGFIGIGLIPDSGGSWFIHRLLGFARAFDWMTTNKRSSTAASSSSRPTGTGGWIDGDVFGRRRCPLVNRSASTDYGSNRSSVRQVSPGNTDSPSSVTSEVAAANASSIESASVMKVAYIQLPSGMT